MSNLIKHSAVISSPWLDVPDLKKGAGLSGQIERYLGPLFHHGVRLLLLGRLIHLGGLQFRDLLL